VLSSEHKLPYSCLWAIDQIEVAIKLSVMYRAKEFATDMSVLYRPNISRHTDSVL